MIIAIANIYWALTWHQASRTWHALFNFSPQLPLEWSSISRGIWALEKLNNLSKITQLESDGPEFQQGHKTLEPCVLTIGKFQMPIIVEMTNS